MKRGWFKRNGFTLVFSVALVGFTAYVMLDTFVIPHAVTATVTATQTETTVQADSPAAEETATVATQTTATQTSTDDSAQAVDETPVVTDSSYVGNGVSITIETLRVSGTTVYVADVQLTSADSLETALAQNTFGTNITQTTSTIAAANNAILAINGDFYGANKRGYVIKNGVLYRSTVRQGSDTEDLVIYTDGSFGVIDETEVSAEELIESGVVQLFAFGPALVEDGEIAVSVGEEVDQAKTSNPRTAIGFIDDLHYLLVVSDGRTSESEGLSLYELAEIMQSYGCTTAYNLDGGGSSTMVFNGSVLNNPTTGGNRISERAVSDIVCIYA